MRQWGEKQETQIWRTELAAQTEAKAAQGNFSRFATLNDYAKLVGGLIRDTCRSLRDSPLLAKVIPAWVQVRAGILEQGSHPNLLNGTSLSELPANLQSVAMAAREAALQEAEQITTLTRFDAPIEGFKPGSSAQLNTNPEVMRFDPNTGELLVWEQPIVPPAMGHLKAPETPGGVQFGASW